MAGRPPDDRAADHAGRGSRQEQPHRPLARDVVPARPPRDCMICSGARTSRRGEPVLQSREIAVDDRLHVGVEGGDDGALVFAERGIDLAGERDGDAGMRRPRSVARVRCSCAGCRNENR